MSPRAVPGVAGYAKEEKINPGSNLGGTRHGSIASFGDTLKLDCDF